MYAANYAFLTGINSPTITNIKPTGSEIMQSISVICQCEKYVIKKQQIENTKNPIPPNISFIAFKC